MYDIYSTFSSVTLRLINWISASHLVSVGADIKSTSEDWGSCSETNNLTLHKKTKKELLLTLILTKVVKYILRMNEQDSFISWSSVWNKKNFSELS